MKIFSRLKMENFRWQARGEQQLLRKHLETGRH